MRVNKEDVYCTSFCNQAHNKTNGHPINHECYVLNPQALSLEIQGKVDEAIDLGIRTDRILKPRAVEII